jgi:hypothetical protein
VTNASPGVDPGFPVHAIADGTVITSSWDPTGFLGNVVVIEHTAPDGTRYRSIYAHLRNGATTDCENSKIWSDDYPPMGGDPSVDIREPLFDQFMSV